MAKVQVRTDAGGLVAEVSVPDSALPIIQEVLGTTTAVETAQKILAYLKGNLRAHVLQFKRSGARQDYDGAYDEQPLLDSIDTAWPPA